MFQPLREKKILTRSIHLLYNNKICGPYTATNQPIKDRQKRRYISIPVNQLWSMTQLRTERTDLHHIRWRFEENDVRVLELNISP